MESTLYGMYQESNESAQQTSEIEKHLFNFKQEKIYIFFKK